VLHKKPNLGAGITVERLRANLRRFWIAGAVVLVLGGTAIVYRDYRSTQTARAAGDLFDAEKSLLAGDSKISSGQDSPESIEKVLRAIASEQTGFAPAYLARLYLAVELSRNQRGEDALTELSRLTSELGNESRLRLIALYVSGRIRESSQDWKGAAEVYGRLGAITTENPYRDLAIYDQARCFNKIGRAEDATALWQQLITEFPDSDLRGLAESRLGP